MASRPLFWGTHKELAIRRGNHKLITNHSFAKPALYDLKADLGEELNIAGENPELVRELLKLLRDWHADVNKDVKKRS